MRLNLIVAFRFKLEKTFIRDPHSAIFDSDLSKLVAEIVFTFLNTLVYASQNSYFKLYIHMTGFLGKSVLLEINISVLLQFLFYRVLTM